MKLTGKCKEDFDKWYSDKYFPSIESLAGHRISLIDKGNISLNRFYTLQPEMQWGVYVDFFHNIEDKTELRMLGKVSKGWEKYYFEFRHNMHQYETINEARNAAIEKANEIYNSKL